MLPKKSLGQNFLMHRQTAERIVGAAGVRSEDTVLEIGPGTGMLTRALLDTAKKVVAVEADLELLPGLETKFMQEIEEGRLILVQDDVRAYDPASIDGSYKLVANIPYYITGELIRKFLTTKHKPASITFLVQKEVAVRISRSKKESLLSLSVKAFGTPNYRFTVPKGAFTPAPTIDSAVLSITDIHTPFSSEAEESKFFEILHAGFAHKRKQLGKNLEEFYTSESIVAALDSVNLSRAIRAEDVPLQAWQVLAKKLKKIPQSRLLGTSWE
jgi:16S rRNA (adenine1518-N6/adenine1519-N6)-dimethyltransferase